MGGHVSATRLHYSRFVSAHFQALRRRNFTLSATNLTLPRLPSRGIGPAPFQFKNQINCNFSACFDLYRLCHQKLQNPVLTIAGRVADKGLPLSTGIYGS